jgi:hypothetical protein
MLILILVIFLAIAVILLASSICLKFRYDEKEKWLAVSYIFARFRADFAGKSGIVSLFAIPIKRIQLGKGKFAGKEIALESKKEKKSKGGSRGILSAFEWNDIQALGGLFKKIRTKNLRLNISGGFGDPFETAKIFSLYTAIAGIFPLVMSHVNFYPDFSNARLQFEGRGLIYIRVLHLTAFLVRFIYRKRKYFLGSMIVTKKKGVSYAQ